MDISEQFAVQMRNITKYFGNFCALDKVSLDIKKGTIHAMLGENGAGKSTLMNILYGFYQASSGDIYLKGNKVNIKNPNMAIANGIGMVHQHFMLVENFTVSQNIILGKEVTNKAGVIDNKKVRQDIQELSKKYGLYVDPDSKIEDITVGMQQRVEILKALYRGAEILILDEPTAVLTPQEIQDLITIMHNLIADGKTIIIITHKLKEIKESSDVCTIIRRGVYIDTVNVCDVDEMQLASMMVGHDVNLHIQKKPAKPEEVIFEIDNLTVADNRGIEKVKNLSLSVRKGEIVGVAGIDGNGQKELVEAITCLSKVKNGKIKIHGKEIQNTTPRNVLDNKLCTIHEDRHKRGLVLDFSVAENFVLENYGNRPFSRSGILDYKSIYSFAKGCIERFDVRPSNCEDTKVRALSGGNQQKVIIAREVTNDPELLVAVQPTRGLDVGAIEYVHKSLVSQRDEGKAVLLISFELDEIMDVSDTIAVLYDGRIVATFSQGEADENTIGLIMAGGGKKNGAYK
ncbi:ABC transporter ATP-binding protein [Clostridium sp. BNL1100]|uniref:ABC transporter ATP-binding protein n=1 Tax=Clostridium sp. BNL1100 TaxID=755731 RepID=UPI00024A7FA6|nr:ABC transporter ATP-binding protein [Clostridium sp. BNL1100]AEY67173.1 ATPase component of uncharacterized ABC-type transporter [Clostridium sp. BNL1100]